MGDVAAYVDLVAKTGAVGPYGRFPTPEAAMLTLIDGMERGLSPSMALSGGYVLKGVSHFFGDALMTLLLRSAKEQGCSIIYTFEGKPEVSIYAEENKNAYWEATITYPDGNIQTVTYGVQDAIAASLWPVVSTEEVFEKQVRIRQACWVPPKPDGTKGYFLYDSPWAKHGKDMLWRKLVARVARMIGLPAGDIDDLEYVGEMRRSASPARKSKMSLPDSFAEAPLPNTE